jgi:hypothetical protein
VDPYMTGSPECLVSLRGDKILKFLSGGKFYNVIENVNISLAVQRRRDEPV